MIAAEEYGFAALTVACGHSRSETAATPAGNTSPSGDTARGSKAGGAVTLVGCLHGPTVPSTTGTAGSKNADRTECCIHPKRRCGSARRRILCAVKCDRREQRFRHQRCRRFRRPTVSDGTSFELDGAPADAQASVNKRVRVTGRVDERPAGAAETGATRGTREDTKANSLTVAGDSAARRIRVETLQLVAQDCSSSR
jgi:hypothetical protein